MVKYLYSLLLAVLKLRRGLSDTVHRLSKSHITHITRQEEKKQKIPKFKPCPGLLRFNLSNTAAECFLHSGDVSRGGHGCFFPANTLKTAHSIIRISSYQKNHFRTPKPVRRRLNNPVLTTYKGGGIVRLLAYGRDRAYQLSKSPIKSAEARKYQKPFRICEKRERIAKKSACPPMETSFSTLIVLQYYTVGSLVDCTACPRHDVYCIVYMCRSAKEGSSSSSSGGNRHCSNSSSNRHFSQAGIWTPATQRRKIYFFTWLIDCGEYCKNWTSLPTVPPSLRLSR